MRRLHEQEDVIRHSLERVDGHIERGGRFGDYPAQRLS